jgi:hypothetical protein
VLWRFGVTSECAVDYFRLDDEIANDANHLNTGQIARATISLPVPLKAPFSCPKSSLSMSSPSA